MPRTITITVGDDDIDAFKTAVEAQGRVNVWVDLSRSSADVDEPDDVQIELAYTISEALFRALENDDEATFAPFDLAEYKRSRGDEDDEVVRE